MFVFAWLEQPLSLRWNAATTYGGCWHQLDAFHYAQHSYHPPFEFLDQLIASQT